MKVSEELETIHVRREEILAVVVEELVPDLTEV